MAAYPREEDVVEVALPHETEVAETVLPQETVIAEIPPVQTDGIFRLLAEPKIVIARSTL